VRRAPLLVLLLGLVSAPAGAVLVRLPAGETERGLPGPALTHLAIVAGLSGVYVGDGWILTAGHVAQAARNQKKTEARIGGAPFALRLDTIRRIRAGGSPADLALVRIEGDPGLPALPIVEKTPEPGTPVVMAGNGPLQEPERACWNPAGQPVAKPGPGTLCGYAWRKTPENQTNGVEWGTNQVSSVREAAAGPQGALTRAFATQFRDGGATPREAQAGVGDSGGPVLVRSGDGWALAGVMLSVAGRSPSAALFGDRTLIADLALYRDAIRREMDAARETEAGARAPGPR